MRASGWFPTSDGVHGLFTISHGPYGDDGRVKAAVTTDSTGAGPGDSLILPVFFGMTIGEPVGLLSILWSTSYDATQMRLQLWRTRYSGATEMVWGQTLSGTRGSQADILPDTYLEGDMFFRVAVLPEPSGIIAVLTGVVTLGLGFVRRRINSGVSITVQTT